MTNRCVVSQVGVEQPLEVEEEVKMKVEEEVKVEEMKVMVDEKVKVEEAASPKCIGPGCSNDALPESVYCGHQCIVRHAAKTMKSQNFKIKPAAPPTEPSIKVMIISSLTEVSVWSVVQVIMQVLQKECVLLLYGGFLVVQWRNSEL